MKANELRIGNWLKNSEGYFQVDCSFFDQISYEGDDLGEGYEIPLTKEWLLKFGLVDMIQNESDAYTLRFYYPFYNSNFSIVKTEFKDKRDSFYCLADNIKIHTEIKYVHQLQNLYFALTGQELEIQELEKNES